VLRIYPCETLLLLLAMLSTTLMKAQEAAFSNGHMVARYEEAKGTFHYLFPCEMPILGSNATVHALCWPATAGQVQVVNGKSQSSIPVSGTLMVSAALVRFIPDDSKVISPIPDLQPSQILLDMTQNELWRGWSAPLAPICSRSAPSVSGAPQAPRRSIQASLRNSRVSTSNFRRPLLSSTTC
jgi:hypothetical protein